MLAIDFFEGINDIHPSINEYVDDIVNNQFELAFLELSKHLSITQEISNSKSKLSGRFSLPYLNNLLHYLSARNCLKLPAMASRFFTSVMLCFSLFSVLKHVLTTEKPLVTREMAKPTQFFSNTSHIFDFFEGSGAERSLLIAHAELTILMLYASWDIKSREARKTFSIVSSTFSHLDMVKFVGVNCHYYHAECRRTFKLYSFPVIFAYDTAGVPIIFNQYLTIDRLSSWIMYLLHPIKSLTSTDKFKNFIASFDFAIIGYLPFKGTISREYQVFLMTSLKLSNLRQYLGFGIIQNSQLASELGFVTPNVLKLYTFYNENFEEHLSSYYLNDSSRSVDSINWIFNYTESDKAVQEINLEERELGGKSEALFNKLNASFLTLIYFTNNLGLHFAQDQQIITIREVSKELYSLSPETCNYGSRHTSFNFQSYIEYAKKACGIQNELIQNCCEEIRKSGFCKRKSADIGSLYSNKAICSDLLSFFNRESFNERCCFENSMEEIRSTGLGWWAKTACRFYRMVRKNDPKLLKNEFESEMQALQQRDCFRSVNKTIRSAFIDKRFARFFLRKWNADDASTLDSHTDALVLVSLQTKRIFWPLRQYGGKFTSSDLENSLHRFIYGNEILPANLDSEEINLLAKSSTVSPDSSLRSTSYVHQLNYHTLLEILNKKRRVFDSVVFVTGGSWHGPSAAVLHIFHIIKNYFNQLPPLIKFFIIDSSKNELPRPFEHTNLPGVLFIPSHSIVRSSIFPTDLPITVPNLLAFILPRVQFELQVHFALTTCKEKCQQRNFISLKNFTDYVEKKIRHLRISSLDSSNRREFLLPLKRCFLRKRIANALKNSLSLLRDAKTIHADSFVYESVVSEFVKLNPLIVRYSAIKRRMMV